MYLSSQILFKTPHKTLKFQEKSISQQSADLNFKNFPIGVYHGATKWSHWTKQTVNQLNLWGKMAVDKSAWMKACNIMGIAINDAPVHKLKQKTT